MARTRKPAPAPRVEDGPKTDEELEAAAQAAQAARRALKQLVYANTKEAQALARGLQVPHLGQPAAREAWAQAGRDAARIASLCRQVAKAMGA